MERVNDMIYFFQDSDSFLKLSRAEAGDLKKKLLKITETDEEVKNEKANVRRKKDEKWKKKDEEEERKDEREKKKDDDRGLKKVVQPKRKRDILEGLLGDMTKSFHRTSDDKKKGEVQSYKKVSSNSLEKPSSSKRRPKAESDHKKADSHLRSKILMSKKECNQTTPLGLAVFDQLVDIVAQKKRKKNSSESVGLTKLMRSSSDATHTRTPSRNKDYSSEKKTHHLASTRKIPSKKTEQYERRWVLQY